MIGIPGLSSLSFPKIGAGFEAPKVFKLAAPIGALFVSLIVFILIVWPKFNDVIKLKISNAELTSRAASLEAKAQLLSSLDKDKLNSQLTASEALLPSDKGVFSLVTQIEKSASASGVILNKVDVSPGSINDSGGSGSGQAPVAQAAGIAGQAADLGSFTSDVPKIQVRVAITSDYKSFIQFLNNLLSLPRVVSIHDLSISSQSVSGQASALKSLMTLDAYWKSLPKELPSIESAIQSLSEGETKRLDNIKVGEVTGGVAGPVVIPSVPTGRSDLFAPF